MNKYNTLLGQYLSLVPRSEFENIYIRRHADKYCKGLSARLELAAMVFAQISGQNGLRSIANALNSEAGAYNTTPPRPLPSGKQKGYKQVDTVICGEQQGQRGIRGTVLLPACTS